LATDILFAFFLSKYLHPERIEKEKSMKMSFLKKLLFLN